MRIHQFRCSRPKTTSFSWLLMLLHGLHISWLYYEYSVHSLFRLGSGSKRREVVSPPATRRQGSTGSAQFVLFPRRSVPQGWRDQGGTPSFQRFDLAAHAPQPHRRLSQQTVRVQRKERPTALGPAAALIAGPLAGAEKTARIKRLAAVACACQAQQAPQRATPPARAGPNLPSLVSMAWDVVGSCLRPARRWWISAPPELGAAVGGGGWT